jgi:hypothetical protein
MTSLLPSLGLLVSLLHILALAGLLVLLLTCRPVRSIAETIRSATNDLGPSTQIATAFISAALAMQLLSGALEQRDTGSSPLAQLPVMGHILLVLCTKQRLEMILIVLSLLALSWAVIARFPGASGQPHRLGHAPTLWIIWLLVGAATTVLGSSQIVATEALSYIATVASMLACLVCIPHLDRQVVHRIAVGLVLATMALTYLLIGLSHSWSFTDVWTGGFHSSRLQGIFPQPNVAGAFHALSCLIVLTQARAHLLGRLVLTAPIAALLYMSGSRGSIVLLIVGLIVAAMARNPGRRLWWILLPLAGASILIPIVNRDVGYGDLAGRAETWRIALELGRSSPLLGAGGFPLPGSGQASRALYAHSQLLQTWAEGGAAGVALLSAAILATLRLARNSRDSLGLSVLIGLMATFPFENPVRLYAPSFAATLVLVVLLASVKDRRAASNSEEPLAQATPKQHRADHQEMHAS